MITIRKSQDRGHANHGWLDSYHSFSFAEYYDPAYMGYGTLRVINEDVIAEGTGFGMHAHRDMEIVTYILSGQLRHQDSMGNTSVIGPGDVQRMTAGSGVRHSEFNASTNEAVHLLQIWILPAEMHLPPSYEERHFSANEKRNQWRLIVSPDGTDDSIMIHQNTRLYASKLDKEMTLDMPILHGHQNYLQLASGTILLNDIELNAGDAVMIENESKVIITASANAELLWFDLAKA
ncbi:MAG TPA: pirin family protein [Methylophilaceae bacterium]|nr:pirin family protein [Methylophilaceae bacterium]